MTTSKRMGRRGAWAVTVLVGALVVSLAVLAGSAFAYFLSTDSSHPAEATAASLSAPTNGHAKTNGATKITVSWTLPGSQLTGAKYQVTRTSPGTPTVICTVSAPTHTCQDTGHVPGTTYEYSIVAVLPGTNWVSSAITASTATTKATPVVTTTTSTTTVVVGRSVHDTATVTGGYAPTGHITWQVYAKTDTNCTKPLFGYSSTETLSGDGHYVSGTLTPEAPGHFIWGLTYAGDAHNSPVKVCGGWNEAFAVVKATPTLSTSAGTSVSIGTPVSDTATLSNGYDPTGTITFELYKTAWCRAEVGSPGTVTVKGNGTYSSPSITPTVAGDYYWIAKYSGDGDNETVAEPCGSKGESVTVTKVTPTVTTTSSATKVTAGNTVTDTATLSGGYDVSGTLTWHVYPSTTPNCTSRNALFSYVGTQTVSGTGRYSPATPLTATKVGSYEWGLTYVGTTGNNNSVTVCGGTHETFTVAPAQARKLVFTTAPVSGPPGSSATLGPITVQERDQFTNPTTTALQVTLSSSSTGTFIFSKTKGATSPTGATRVTITAGTTSVTFFYGDTKVGTPTITAAHIGLTKATQQETIRKVNVVETATATGSSSATATFADHTTNGDTLLILVYVESNTHGDSTVTVTGTSLSGSAALVATAASKPTSTAEYKLWVYRATADGSSTHRTVKVTATHECSSYVHVDVVEISGDTTTTPIRRDGVGASTSAGRTPTAALPSTPTPGDLELLFFGTSGNDGGITTPPAGTWVLVSAANSSSSKYGVGSYYTATTFAMSPKVKVKSSVNWAAIALDVAV